MQFDLPLILVILVSFTGTVWVLDKLLWQPRRLAAMQAAGSRKKEAAKSGKKQEDAVPERSVLVEYAASFFPFLLLVLLLRSFLAEPYQIPSGSMIPSLAIGDFILVNKYAYGLRLPVAGTKIMSVKDPQRGEVMVFIAPHKKEYFIKRVIGVPGDHIRYEDKMLYINDEPADQKFVAALPPGRPVYRVYEEQLAEAGHMIHTSLADDSRKREWKVPEGHYFMMGDNRDRSSDSRHWGFVPEQNIVGQAVAVWMHKKPGFNLPGFSRNGWIQ